MDASGRWYQVDGHGDRIMKHRHRRRYVCGLSSSDWRPLTKAQKAVAFEAALDRRESEGKPRYPTGEENIEWQDNGSPGFIAFHPPELPGDDSDPRREAALRSIDRAAAAMGLPCGNDYYHLPILSRT